MTAIIHVFTDECGDMVDEVNAMHCKACGVLLNNLGEGFYHMDPVGASYFMCLKCKND